MKIYLWLIAFAGLYGAAAGCGSSTPQPSPPATGGSGGSSSGGGSGGQSTGGQGAGGSGGAWTSAVGDSGIFVKTFDGSAWQASKPAAVDLYGVTCVGNLVGWAVGANGAVLHTLDGGDTWAAQYTPVSITLRAVRFSDLNAGWAVGDAGTVIATTDGGQHWNIQVSGVSVNLNGVAVAQDGHTAWAVGDQGTVLNTANGGAEWAKLSAPTGENLYGLGTDELGSGWIVGENGTLIRLQQNSLHLEAALTSATLRAVHIPDGQAMHYSALAVGDAGTILALPTGSPNWQLVESGTNVTLRAALVMTEGGEFAYVAGDQGTLLKSPAPEDGFTAIDSHTTLTLRSLDDL